MLIETFIYATYEAIIFSDSLKMHIQRDSLPLDTTAKTIIDTRRTILTQQIILIIAINPSVWSLRVAITSRILIQDTTQIGISSELLETFRLQGFHLSRIRQQVIGDQTRQDSLSLAQFRQCMQVTPFSISGILIQYIPTITCESQIQIGGVSNVAIRSLIHPSQGQLTASPRTFGIVFRSQSLSVRAWECHRTRSEDIYLFPIKGIERSRQTIIEETKIQTTIISSRGCPCQGIVRSRSSHNRICQVITEDIFFTQFVLLQIRERIHLVYRVLAQIHIVTRRTIRGTDLQITQPIGRRLHKRLLADTPCGGH